MTRSCNLSPLWTSILMILTAGAFAGDKPESDALGYFLLHSADVASSARGYLNDAPPVLRNEAREFPVLRELGPVMLQMTLKDVNRVLGRPDTKEEIEEGWRWTYPRDNGTKMVIVANLEESVVRIFSDAQTYPVPIDLGVGSLLVEFEKVYGSRRYRKSGRVSRKLKLVKYPFSNLALVVDSESGEVRSLMVFQARSAEE